MVDVICRMNQSRFANTVCSIFTGDDLKPELLSSGVPVIELGLRDGKKLDALKSITRLSSLIRNGRYSAIHTWLYQADILGRIAGRMAGAPLIISALQNSWYEPEVLNNGNMNRAKFNLARNLDKWTGKLSHARFVACSDFVRDSMIKRLGLPGEKVDVIYNAVDPERFDLSDQESVNQLRVQLGLTGCSPLLACVSRLVPQKGQAYLLEAQAKVVTRFPGARLLIIGEGEEVIRLKEQASRLNIENHTQFLGLRADVRELLQAADIFVFPSLCGEGLPVAMVEAMAVGKPCIAWRLEPNPELIEPGRSGILVEPESTDALAEAICSLAEQPETQQVMGRRGREIVEEKFNIHQITRQFETLYERNLNGAAQHAVV
jgi:glycosyltransferase involved in cell wall biosynthesis